MNFSFSIFCQNRASAEDISTDDEESDDNEEEMDYEEMGKSIEKILVNKKTSQQFQVTLS